MVVTPRPLVASNHDDGKMDLKGRAAYFALDAFRQ
jgi:hypothetical protein